MKKITTILLALLLFSSCATRTIDIKSPCVAKENGPCGPRKPVNDWWLGKTV